MMIPEEKDCQCGQGRHAEKDVQAACSADRRNSRSYDRLIRVGWWVFVVGRRCWCLRPPLRSDTSAIE